MKRVAEIIETGMKPTGIVPCEGCGARVEAALFFGRIVYACDDCAKWERREKPQKDGKEER